MPEPNEKTVEELQLEQIEQLKQKMDKMVDPSEHEKLQKQYKQLLNDYVNKRQAPAPQPETLRPAKEVARELMSVKDGNISNREYVKKALEYRKSYMNEFGTDPFADFGEHGSSKSNPDTEEVADKLQKLLDENESPVDFRIKMNSMLQDDPLLLSKLRKRAS